MAKNVALGGDMPGSAVRLSLTRLRLGFLLLGCVLLGSLLVLSMLVKERLKEASRDRESMVASRVFDELEREVSIFLEEENERELYGNLANTDPQSWAPFVVGYFKWNRFHVEHVAADGATSENRRRILWAVSEATPSLTASEQNVTTGQGAQGQQVGAVPGIAEQDTRVTGRKQLLDQRHLPDPAARKSALPPTQKKEASGSEIIDSLNRAPVRRKSQAPQDNKDMPQDPFGDYAERY